MTSTLPPTSFTVRSRRPRPSSKIRSARTFAATRSPSSGRSSAATASNTARPGPIVAMASSATCTEAERTRWTTARTAARPLLVQHPGVVAADDGLDLARGEMPGREHRHALFERQPCNVRDLPEAVAVLVQERLAVDLEALTAIGGCCGHTASMEKGPRARAQRVGVMSRGYSEGGQGTGAGGGAS